MSRASEIIVLCEDLAHEMFITRFLKKGWKIKPRAFRVSAYPNGDGSGKRHVQDNIDVEARELRKKRVSKILIVVQDADEFSVEQVRSDLENRLNPPRSDKEQIAFIIPKWHIQTWLAYLDGESVNESDKESYVKKYGKKPESKEAHPYIDKLANDCKMHNALESPPDSLLAACEEFDRIRSALS